MAHAAAAWSTHATDNCCSSTCCCACVLPCVVVAENVTMMEEHGMERIPIVSGCAQRTGCSTGTCAGVLYGLGILGSVVGSNLTAASTAVSQSFCISSWLSVYLHSRFRETIRKHYGIPADCCGENGCSDCCCALCCYSCAMAQERRMLQDSGLQATHETQYYPGLNVSTMSRDQNF